MTANIAKVDKSYLGVPKLPKDFEDVVWCQLSSALQAIQKDQSLPYHIEELYKACESLCRYGFGPNTYSKLYQECQTLSRLEYDELTKHIDTSNGEEWLQLIVKAWNSYCKKIYLIRNIFNYLDRTYMLKTENVLPIWETGLELFKFTTLADPVIKKTISNILLLIEKERKDELIDRGLVKDIIKLLLKLNVYKDTFEETFLQKSTQFYHEEAIKLIKTSNVPEYLMTVERILNTEEERADYFFIPATKNLLLNSIEERLITINASIVLDQGFDSLMENNNIEELSRLFKLFHRVNQLEILKLALSAYVKKVGLQIIEAENREPVSIVLDILQFKTKLDTAIQQSFDNRDEFQYALKEAFESFMNIKHSKSAEWIAKYLDHLLRATTRSSEEDIETVIEKVLTIFRYVQGKDIFEAFYKKDLARRLLMGKSASMDVEKIILTKLKAECGPAFTLKLEGMFKDMEVSKEIEETFQSSHKYSEGVPAIDMNTAILTAVYWPSYPNQKDFILPHALLQNQEAFSRFYHEKYSGRRLIWNYHLGYCIIKANFSAGPKELIVSLYQAAVLHLFTDAKSYKVKQIQEKTGLDKDELEKTLYSLIFGKAQILLKSPDAKTFALLDEISVNDGFVSKLYRVPINTVQFKETPEEQASTTEQVQQDRQYQIDAAIVRLMKASKSLSHTQLISELISILKFPIEAADIKKRIESLIERDFIQRDPDNSSVYIYLA